MAFGANTTENLKDICEQRYREWKALCASRPGFAAEQEDEYRRYKNTWRGSTTGSRTASRGSQESTAVSRRPGFDAQSIVSQTIYEDQISLFDGKAQCAVYQPGVGGAESVRRKRTRRRSKGSKGTSNTSSLASVNDKASVCSMGPKHRSPTREVFTNLTKRLSVVSLWGTA
ncbi:hypothetical protein TRAPUB_727 [Trametes pubescens]|uniref:Uncharacterized protein n=1 Tax=Trametes pubescens TaxID=154538 RepID=A0A1M2VLD8_TRAPU|nr:hypothetical protein TRAPUB_727 [Trametes pubescens]